MWFSPHIKKLLKAGRQILLSEEIIGHSFGHAASSVMPLCCPSTLVVGVTWTHSKNMQNTIDLLWTSSTSPSVCQLACFCRISFDSNHRIHRFASTALGPSWPPGQAHDSWSHWLAAGAVEEQTPIGIQSERAARVTRQKPRKWPSPSVEFIGIVSLMSGWFISINAAS